MAKHQHVKQDKFADDDAALGKFAPTGTPEQDTGVPSTEGPGETEAMPEPGHKPGFGKGGMASFGGFKKARVIRRAKESEAKLPKGEDWPPPGG